MRRWLLCAAVALSASAFTVHQHATQEQCLDLQCPSTAFEYGIRNLVSEETLRSDRCQSCHQCTASGYSVCMKLSDSRGRRGSQTEGCSCTHSVPANCHNEPSRAPPNMTMSTFHICYLSALQAPPRSLAVNNKETVIVTVEPFWTEPYWRDLQLENLTLHYEFPVRTPENCEGDLITTESEHVEHMCKDSVKLEMDGRMDGETGGKNDEDYEHSEGYQEYDDSLPPEVAFDRDVFDGAKLLKVYYTIQVRRPRQLATGSDPFRDQTTLLDSEVLKFDLKPETYGTGLKEDLPVPTGGDNDVLEKEPAPTDEDEDVSEERGGTNFFDDDLKEEKDTKSEEEEEKEDEELEKKIEDEEEATTVAELTTTEEKEEETTTVEDKEEDKAEETGSLEEEEQEDTIVSKPASDEKEEDGESTTPSEEDDETTTEESEDGEDKSHEEEEEEAADKPKEKTIKIFGYMFNKWSLAQLCFFICLCSFLLILSLYCCRKCCCKSEDKSTTSNGYRYNSANRTDLVSPPEKERLHQ